MQVKYVSERALKFLCEGSTTATASSAPATTTAAAGGIASAPAVAAVLTQAMTTYLATRDADAHRMAVRDYAKHVLSRLPADSDDEEGVL